MRARVSALMRCWVWGLRGACREMISEVAKNSSRETRLRLVAEAPSRARACTFMPKASAMRATADPVSPKPTMPMVLPASSVTGWSR